MTVRRVGDGPPLVWIHGLGESSASFDPVVRAKGALEATRTIDVGVLREDGLPAQAGVAFATAVNPEGAPIVSRALAGSFTVANLLTSSAGGAAGAGRSAVALSGSGVSEPAIGTVIDGASVLLKAIRPDRLTLAVYYDPATLQPASEG